MFHWTTQSRPHNTKTISARVRGFFIITCCVFQTKTCLSNIARCGFADCGFFKHQLKIIKNQSGCGSHTWWQSINLLWILFRFYFLIRSNRVGSQWIVSDCDGSAIGTDWAAEFVRNLRGSLHYPTCGVQLRESGLCNSKSGGKQCRLCVRVPNLGPRPNSRARHVG